VSTVHLDFETRSPLDLKKVGAARYAEKADIICAAYAVDGHAPEIWVPGDPFPGCLAAADVIVAHNAFFEYIVWQEQGARYGWPEPPKLEKWCDTMAGCCYAGLPRGLGFAVMHAGLPREYWKDPRGQWLVTKSGLCRPRKATKTRPAGYNEDPELLAELYAYCKQDVVAERALHNWLPPLPALEQKIWVATQKMNVRGFPVDREFVLAAVKLVAEHTTSLNAEASELAEGYFDTLAQVAKFKKWLGKQGLRLPDLQKKTVENALARNDLSPTVRRVLEIRTQVGLASIKKYVAAKLRVCEDGAIKGAQIYHAAGTGRWSATGFQPHNIARPTIKPPEVAGIIRQVKAGEPAGEDPLTVLSNCLRGVICARPGRRLAGSDYKQIELRVLLWLAGANKQLASIAAGGDPYKDMAAAYYKTPLDEVTAYQRQVGKSAVLGCGFSLGGIRFREYAANMGVEISEAEAIGMVKLYRDTYPEVVAFWYALQDAAIRAVKFPGPVVRCLRIYLRVQDRWLQMRLPSGRSILYYQPRVELLEKPWGTVESVTFLGMDTYTRQYDRTHTYGGKLVENATQGTARDVLARGLLRAEARGLEPVLTVHDELLVHSPVGCENPREALDSCMLAPVPWAKGLPIEVESWAGKRYRK